MLLEINNYNIFVPKLNTIADCPIFGFSTKERTDERMLIEGVSFNYFRLASYIPGVHLIVGVGLIALAILTQIPKVKGNREIAGRLAVRGVLTCIFGPVLAVADFAKQYLQNKEIEKTTGKKPSSLIQLKV